MLMISWWELCDVFYFFFFFQAEDGIRDGTVTGVQTCALPIYLGIEGSAREAANDLTRGFERRSTLIRPVGGDGIEGIGNGENRSEERRVGKECRSRWSRYH